MNELLPFQNQLLDSLPMCKVIYRDMYKNNNPQLGYCSNGDLTYDINLANDVPEKQIQNLVLVHELGHINLHHLELQKIDLVSELKYVRMLFKDANVEYSKIMKLGGPFTFLNVAMDFEVNTKFLTKDNIQYLNSKDIKLWHIDNYNDFEYHDNFREYYRDLIKYIDKSELNEKSNNGFSFGDIISDNIDENDLKSDQNSQSAESENNQSSNQNSQLTDSEIQEIQDALAEEGYIDGNNQSYNENNIVGNDSVSSYDSSNTNVEDNNAGKKSSLHSTIVAVDGRESLLSELKKLILNIVKTKNSYMPDSIRLHNRQLRPNNKLLYSSKRLKHNKIKTKLGIMIDTSGSMQFDDIVKVIAELAKNATVLNSNTTVYFGDVVVSDSLSIKDISKPFHLNLGGGTNIPNCVLNGPLKDGYDNVIIYSDFESNGSFVELKDKYPNVDFYSVCQRGIPNSFNNDVKNFIEKICKKSIIT